MIFRNDYVDFGQGKEAKLLCLALNACHGGTKDDTVFMVPKFTNSFDYPHLNIERLNFWHGTEFTHEKLFEIYDLILNEKHSNITEGMALSRFGNSFQGMLLYSTNFKTGIDYLLDMYELNEKGVSIRKILNDFGFSKLQYDRESIEIHDRFREILKYCIVNHHIIALNTREIIPKMDKAINSLFDELYNEIREETS
jgi:hypothetical protein